MTFSIFCLISENDKALIAKSKLNYYNCHSEFSTACARLTNNDIYVLSAPDLSYPRSLSCP